MKVPLSWLKEYVEIDITTEELLERLTAIGHMQDKPPEKVGEDTVLDLEVRQNRPDCLSIIGIAREVSSSTGGRLTLPSVSSLSKPQRSHTPTLTIDNNAPSCRRFIAVHMKIPAGSKDRATPGWMRERLKSYGMSVISPLVDITNYVMIEYGQPLHAFDIRHIPQHKVIIRQGREDEQTTLIGGRTITLTDEDMVVASQGRVLSLAGIIGAQDTGVDEDTTEIILEAATYNQATIRRSSLRHTIRTEASTRHEKFLHPDLAMVAVERTVSLILDICGGEIVDHADNYPNPEEERVVDLHLTEIERLGGIDMPAEVAEDYLTSLGFTIARDSSSEFRVSIPYWRTDVLESVDLVEEVLRLYGYSNLVSSLPPSPPPKDITSVYYTLEEQIRDTMLTLGYDEQITDPLISYRSDDGTSDPRVVMLQNALNTTKNAMRTSMRGGLMDALTHQRKLGRDTLAMFEIGRVYYATSYPSEPYQEVRQVGVIMSDSGRSVETLYLDLKGALESLVRSLGGRGLSDPLMYDIVDPHTVFVSLPIDTLCTNTARYQVPSSTLVEGIPRHYHFDVSFIVDAGRPLGDIFQSLQEILGSAVTITLGEAPLTLPGRKKSVLLKFDADAASTSRDALLSRIHTHLTQIFKVSIR